MNKLLATFIIAASLIPQTAWAVRLWSSGAELNSATSLMEYHLVSGAGCTIDSTIKRTGSYSTKCTTAASTRQGFVHQFASSVGNGPYYFRSYVYVDTRAGGGSNTIFVASSAATISGSAWVAIYQQTTGELRAIVNAATTLTGSSPVLNNGQWYRLEVMVNAVGGAGGGNDEIRAYLDGVEFASTTTATLSGTFLAFRWGTNHLAAAAANAGTYYFDDVAMNDSTGTAQTGLPGEGNIVHLRPNGVGDNSGFSRGGADSGANWSQLGETPPNDITDYVTATFATDDYNVEDTTGLIDSYDTVTLVHVGHRSNTTANPGPSAGARIKKTSGGTVATDGGTGMQMTSTTWLTNHRNIPRNYYLTRYTDPDGAAWTTSTLDSMQIGTAISAPSGNSLQTSAMWALVEYVDGTPPAAFDGGRPVMNMRGWMNFRGRANFRQ